MYKNNNNPKSTIAHRVILGALTLIATLAAILIIVLALGACTPEALTDQPTTDPDTHGGTLIIGNITVGTPASPTAGAANTRLTPEGTFATGDKIVVNAQYYKPAPTTRSDIGGGERSSTTVSVIYILQADGTWKLDETVPGNGPIIVERIKAGTTPYIDSYGGMAEQTSYSYINQSTALNYRLNDWMFASTTTLNGRTLTATMQHMTVDIVVNITDAATAALPAGSTLKLKGISGRNPEWITAWNSGTTTGTTTFRACVEVEDVPGITDVNYDHTSITTTGTVTGTHLLGTLTYTPAGSMKEKTLNIKYSIKETTPGTPTTIKNGMRITVNVPFSDLTAVTGTATVTSWNDTDGGEVGTIEGVALSTGLNGDPGLNYLTADNPTWMITGNDAQVLTNVASKLSDAARNNRAARIHLMLTGFAGEITSDAFKSCTALASISAPKATNIGSSAFYDCDALTTVSLPAAENIGYNAFYNCTDLTRLELTQSTKPITVSSSAFDMYVSGDDSGDGSFSYLITLVLASNDPKVLARTGVSVNGSTVTFVNDPDNLYDDATLPFAAIEYITPIIE